jgi:hypothetical protein
MRFKFALTRQIVEKIKNEEYTALPQSAGGDAACGGCPLARALQEAGYENASVHGRHFVANGKRYETTKRMRDLETEWDTTGDIVFEFDVDAFYAQYGTAGEDYLRDNKTAPDAYCFPMLFNFIAKNSPILRERTLSCPAHI